MENQPKTPCPPREEIFRHYGYPKDTPDKGIAVGNWEKDDAFERLAFLPELIPYLDKSKKSQDHFRLRPGLSESTASGHWAKTVRYPLGG